MKTLKTSDFDKSCAPFSINTDHPGLCGGLAQNPNPGWYFGSGSALGQQLTSPCGAASWVWNETTQQWIERSLQDQYANAQPVNPNPFKQSPEEWRREFQAELGTMRKCKNGEKEMSCCGREELRVVRLFIADTDQDVPLDERVLYFGEEFTTDSTDEELWIELGIKTILAEHNAKRAKILDESASAQAGREVFLKPIKTRDLEMRVMVLAAV